VSGIRIRASDLKTAAGLLRAGDRVLLSGDVYTARDAAHKKIAALLDAGEDAPFDIHNAVIYYAGPTPGHDDIVIGSCGPTTSSRMDKFAPRLYDLGLGATIGKGERSQDVAEAIKRNTAIYLCAVGGAGALIAQHIKQAEEIAFPELGCESVKRLIVEDMPLVVAVDCHGGDIFREGREKYKIG
jgi:fumarate hydratase subunit beta